jgi:IS5 family transposase
MPRPYGRKKGITDRPEPGGPRQARQQAARAAGAQGIPLAVGASAANVHDSHALQPLIQAIPAVRSRRGPRRRRPGKLRGDKAYHSADALAWLRGRGIIPRIAARASSHLST